MNMRNWISPTLLALAVVCGAAHADQLQINIPAHSAKVGIDIAVPANAKILSLSASASSAGSLVMLLKDGDAFDPNGSIIQQADYLSNNTGGPARLAVGTYGNPPLHEGTWHVAIANRAPTRATVTLTTSISTTAKVPTDFEINFGAAPKVLETVFGGADELDCDVGPWTDSKKITVNGGVTTLGAFRQSLLKSTLSELSTQIHSPVPVHVQACWKKFDDSGAHAGSYTLAAAQGTYSFRGDTGMPYSDVWYAMAPAERLAGHRNCQQYPSVDCAIPEIIVWYNSADAAKHNYDGPEDEALIKSVTMHEITHGLGFLSMLGVSEKTDDDKDNPNFLKFNDGYVDAYTANVGFLSVPPLDTGYRTVSLLNLTHDSRKKALTSGSQLVWMDPALADNPENVLSSRTPPQNLVELHAPSTIQPGSTLSHLSGVHRGQLMTAVIQGNFPQTLGLAGPMLARVGWNTKPIDLSSPYDHPVSGNWYDPDHDGHGIELEPSAKDPSGTIYTVVFFTFDDAGKPEYYLAPSRLKNGHMGSFDDPNQPAAVGRPIFDPAVHHETYPDGPVGTLSIDFTPAAASAPACADHDGDHLAVMHWSIGDESGDWCISPALNLVLHPSPAEDLNGFWNAGDSDRGWGFATIEQSDEQGDQLNTGLLYYYNAQNQPTWALVDPGQSSDNIFRPQGYCRTCEKQALTGTAIGNMGFNLTSPEHVELPSGDNSVDINIGQGQFQRTGTAVRMYSLPATEQ